VAAVRKRVKLYDEDLCDLLNRMSEDSDEDIDYSDSSDGCVNTDQSD
jgi:hypothetical protein